MKNRRKPNCCGDYLDLLICKARLLGPLARVMPSFSGSSQISGKRCSSSKER